MNLTLPGLLPNHWTELFILVSIVLWFCALVANILFAAGVARDARRMLDEGREITLAPPLVWVLATLAGGVFVAVAYWLVHHSSLKRSTGAY